jgi:YVTN family beta-propeller protein
LNGPEGIAFTPDGSEALAAVPNLHEVVPITVASNTSGPPINMGSGHTPFQIAVTPDGTKAYATNVTGSAIGVTALPGGAVGSDITVGGDPRGIAITPDGSTAYVANFGGGSGSTVTPITLSNNSPGSPVTVGTGPYAVAVTPDGKTVYVTSGSGTTVVPIDTATNTAESPITVGGDPRGIAITPDQAPVANFTVSSGPPGTSTSFDAGSSAVAFGTIANYAWDFGDGTAVANTSSPTTSHVYAASGTYTARVVETTGAGTSTSGEVFTGQTASRVGMPSAGASRSVVISTAPAPAVTLSASLLAFGTVGVGQPSVRKG